MMSDDLWGHCPICGQQSSFTAGKLKNINERRGHPVFDNRHTHTCEACLSSWCIDSPTSEELATYYTRDYPVGRVSDGHLKTWPNWDTRSTQLITLGRMFGQFKPNDVFMDIGPGHGNALGSAGQLLPSPRFACIEFNPQGIAHMRKALGQLHVEQSVGAMLDAFGEGGVQFVYSAHSFEHFEINELRRALGQLRRLIARDGVLAIEVPQAGAEFFNMANNHVPHLTFFSVDGLSALLRSCGFDVKVCTGAWGQNPRARNHVAAHYGKTPASPAYKAKLEALNNGDWLAREPGLVIKCIATPAQ